MRILVIEDDLLNMEILSLILQTMGYEVIESMNGIDGYKRALKEKPELILTDYHMPGLNGVELTQKIRATDGISDIPVIAVTADMNARQVLIKAGCNAYLAKPIRGATLLRTVKQVLNTHSI